MMSNKFYEFTKVVDLYDYKEDEYYNLETEEYEQIYIEHHIKKNFKISREDFKINRFKNERF